jgi:lipid-A-disaccharide synthase
MSKIRERVDRVICVLPFEKVLYEKAGIRATYIGHPFLNTVRPICSKSDFLSKLGITDAHPIVTVMPGSRENEIAKHMPVLLDVIARLRKQFPNLAALLPLAENIDESMLDSYLSEESRIITVKGFPHDSLAYSDLALVASGSATLEAAILGTPTIVIYKVSPLSYALARMLVKVKHISLPNIIAGKEVFPEFIQRLKPEDIAEKAIYMLNNGRDQMTENIRQIRVKLGAFDSYELAGKEIVNFLGRSNGTLFKAS